MAGYFATEAWVLDYKDRGEADRLITFFTKDLGRIDAFAKGVRLAKSKLKGHLNLFSRARIIITPSSAHDTGKEYWRLLDAESVGTTKSQRRNGYTQKFVKLFLMLAPEREVDWDLWDTLEGVVSLDSIEKLAQLKIQTLMRAGLLPQGNDLGVFFTGRAQAFITNIGDGSFLADPVEERLFEEGIDQILSSNHMVYSKDHGA